MPQPTNPYQPVSSIETTGVWVDPDVPRSTPVSRIRLSAWLLVYGFPVLATASVYGCWLIAWMVLGHRPKPMIDDPGYIGGLMDVVYPLAMLMLVALPPALPCGLIASFFCPAVRRLRMQKGAMLLVGYVCICTLAICLLRADPGLVVEWFFD